MKHLLFVSCTFIFSFFSCKQFKKQQASTKIDEDLLLIQTCVNSILSLDKGLNREKYLVDFSAVKFDRQVIDSFFKLNPNASETNLDSLIAYDSTWVKYQYFENPVIRFNEINHQIGNTFLVKTSKTKASDGAIGTEIILRRKEDGFECVKSAITWIS